MRHTTHTTHWCKLVYKQTNRDKRAISCYFDIRWRKYWGILRAFLKGVQKSNFILIFQFQRLLGGFVSLCLLILWPTIPCYSSWYQSQDYFLSWHKKEYIKEETDMQLLVMFMSAERQHVVNNWRHVYFLLWWLVWAI
jgi:hypothetical protein